MEHKIKLFPSSWLYNAGVIGFLRVLAYGMGEEKIENWLKDDGTVEVDSKSFEKDREKSQALDSYYKFHDSKPPIVGNSIYRNFINPSRKAQDEASFIEFVSALYTLRESEESKSCSICGRKFNLNCELSEEAKKFLETRQRFDIYHGYYIAPTSKLPNSFWNLNTSFYLCPLCVYLLIHHHIPFIKTQHGGIFINAPSFKIMWYLNKLAKEFLQRGKEFTLREILGTSLMELTQRIYLTLGVWSLMQIEMVITKTKNTEVAYYSLPFNTARILLNRNVANLVSATQEPYILQCVLNEDFEALLFLSHCILGVLQGRKDQSLEGKIKNQNRSHLSTLAQILPTLYVKINSLIKGA